MYLTYMIYCKIRQFRLVTVNDICSQIFLIHTCNYFLFWQTDYLDLSSNDDKPAVTEMIFRNFYEMPGLPR